MKQLTGEAVYLWYYFEVQLRQLLPFWAAGTLIGSLISVFGKQKIGSMLEGLGRSEASLFGIIAASLLGIASPVCMYGTVPVAACLAEKGVKEELLAAFAVGSVLLNPQLLIYSAALGPRGMTIRFVVCFLCGIGAGLLVRSFCRDKGFFSFGAFGEEKNRDTDPRPLVRLLKNVGRNIKATGPWLLAGILLTCLFQRYVPKEAFASLFVNNRQFGLLMAGAMGVPLYACGGGSIPLLAEWLQDGMSMGAAAAFMITGPATKITNLGALKIILGAKSFGLYLAYIVLFALAAGLAVDLAGMI